MMRKFRELTEAKETVVFGFGRFNPSTIGHEAVIEKIASVAKGNPFFIYPSHTTGPKDPLKHSLKIAWMRKMFPKYKKNIIVDNKAKTVINIAEKLYKDGYKNLILVAGSDRVKEFDTLLQRYNDAPDKKGNQLFKFDSVKVVSAGERDPDADGVAGMSASKLRKAASDGKFDDFKKGIPNTLKDADKKKYYFDVRKGMGIREEREMGDDYDSLRDAYLTGKIWNVGEVVEAKGLTGEVVRKGTNYLSFVTEDGKVHKAWLHEIEAKEAKSPLQKLKDFDKSRVAAGKPPIFTDKKPPKFIRMKKAGMMTIMNVPTDEIDKFEKKGYKIIEEVDLDERNYKKEYANYQGTPEQIARRSSRNKARRAMGDKVVKGMDVGHKDNNPLNNDPKNLRNEDPSKNRREPRLREEEEVDEAWYNDLAAKMSQIRHPKGWEKLAKMYADGMKDPEHRKHPSAWAQDVAQQVRGIDGRQLVKYINKLVDAGKLPKELKAEYQEEETMHTFSDLVKQINEVKQDKDVDDKDGTQPAKYYAGDMAKSTKDKRDAHFKAKKAGPAPGDSAKTKPSVHTKKFKQMYGEALPKDADQSDYIKDFEKSDAPQFKGKSKKKRKDMAIAAYLSKKEDFTHYPGQVDPKKDKSDGAFVRGDPSEPIEFDGSDTKSILDKANKDVENERSLKQKPFVEEVELDEKITALVNKAKKSGMPYSILKKVYDRGMAAYKTGHRPGATPQQWALARVNSFVTKSSGTWGKADKDLAKQVEMVEKIEEDGPCWDTHKQVGMKKKGGKMVPNCVPKNEDLNEWGEIEEESEYQGRKVTLNKPTKGDVKKSKVYVKNEKGNVVKVEFGDPNMQIQKDIPARRKSFRARHNCDNPGPKWKARYWSCKAW